MQAELTELRERISNANLCGVVEDLLARPARVDEHVRRRRLTRRDEASLDQVTEDAGERSAPREVDPATARVDEACAIGRERDRGLRRSERLFEQTEREADSAPEWNSAGAPRLERGAASLGGRGSSARDPRGEGEERHGARRHLVFERPFGAAETPGERKGECAVLDLQRFTALGARKRAHRRFAGRRTLSEHGVMLREMHERHRLVPATADRAMHPLGLAEQRSRSLGPLRLHLEGTPIAERNARESAIADGTKAGERRFVVAARFVEAPDLVPHVTEMHAVGGFTTTIPHRTMDFERALVGAHGVPKATGAMKRDAEVRPLDALFARSTELAVDRDGPLVHHARFAETPERGE